MPKAHQGPKVSTIRIVDKVSQPKQTEKVGSHKSSATVDHPSPVGAIAPPTTLYPPTQVHQDKSETNKVTDAEEGTDDMRNATGSGVRTNLQTTAPTTIPTQIPPCPISYATKLAALVQEVRDEKTSAAASACQSSNLKPANTPVSPWGKPQAKSNAWSTVAPSNTNQATAGPPETSPARQALASSPAFDTTAASPSKPSNKVNEKYRWSTSAEASASRPKKKVTDRYKWGRNPPKQVDPPTQWDAWERDEPPYEGYQPQVRKWLENVSDTPEDAEAANSFETAPIQEEGETTPASRPRTPDKAEYDIVLKEYMNTGGKYVEDDDKWCTDVELQKLREGLRLPKQGARAKKQPKSTQTNGRYLDAGALNELEQRAFADKHGNPAWMLEGLGANDGWNDWPKKDHETKTDEQNELAGSTAGDHDAGLTWGESKHMSSSEEKPTGDQDWGESKPSAEQPSWQNKEWNSASKKDNMASDRPRGPISAVEKQRRRENNLCGYCGAADHFVRNCNRKPKSNWR